MSAPSILLLREGGNRRPALFSVSPARLGSLLPLLIRGNNYESGQVIKLKHKWLHEPGWLFYKLFPGLIKEKYGSAHPRCHSAGKNEEKKAPATNFNKSTRAFKRGEKTPSLPAFIRGAATEGIRPHCCIRRSTNRSVVCLLES